MKAVDPCPANNCSYTSVMGQAGVMEAWGGGAFDTTRDRLLVWGGGHADYAGNELYAFDLNTLSWTRLTEPSTDVGGVESSGEYPDDKPRSRHTYNYIQYSPVTDRFYTVGGGGLFPSGQVGTTTVNAFDFKTNSWLRLNPIPGESGPGSHSGVDTQTGHIWLDAGGIVMEYDPVADNWTTKNSYDALANRIMWNYSMTGVVDPVHKKFVSIGGGKVYVHDISDPSKVTSKELATTGDTAVIMGKPGVDYHAPSRTIVAWGGGSDIYTLDLDTNVWTKHISKGGATPTAAATNGTYGRFRYSEKKNFFVVVNHANENVYIYKPDFGTNVGPTSTYVVPFANFNSGMYRRVKTSVY
jgi:hypothetical protein